MLLIDWLKENVVSDADFAERYNARVPPGRQVTASAVRKWMYRERTPGVDGIIVIEAITDGKVALRDWQSPALAQAGGGAP
jgi:hypothetical protein